MSATQGSSADYEERTLPPDRGAPTDTGLVTLWSFREDVAIETRDDGGFVVLTRWGETAVPPQAPMVHDSLRRMTFGPVVLDAAGQDRTDLAKVLDGLPGCVVRSLGHQDLATPLMSIIPVSPLGHLTLPDLAPSRPIRLSRFTVLREKDGEPVLESPLSHFRVVLHRTLAAWVAGSVGKATTVGEVTRDVRAPAELVAEAVRYLVAAGMVVTGESTVGQKPARFGEDTDPGLAAWSPTDLLFHSRSRLGRHDEPAGAVFANMAGLSPPPAVKPVPPGRRFELRRPDLSVSAEGELTLTQAIEQRHSVREFDETGPSISQLGDLLYRTARVRTQTEAIGAGGARYQVSTRPYPSAGSLYELDLYLTVERCAGLPNGIYHYDPAGHALTLVNDRASDLDALLSGASVQTNSKRRPPVLITMTARMSRLSWVYDSISYATALKHVGVLQQTLYLVATMLGLAPCALAMGDGELASSALGLEWPVEVSVGEFVIGLPVAGDTPAQMAPLEPL